MKWVDFIRTIENSLFLINIICCSFFSFLGRLLQQTTTATNSTMQNPLDETSRHSNGNLLETIKTEPKSDSNSGKFPFRLF